MFMVSWVKFLNTNQLRVPRVFFRVLVRVSVIFCQGSYKMSFEGSFKASFTVPFRIPQNRRLKGVLWGRVGLRDIRAFGPYSSTRKHQLTGLGFRVG